MKSTDEKIKVDDLLNKISDSKKREELKNEFIKLEQLRFMPIDSLIADKKKAIEKLSGDMSALDNKIKEIEGASVTKIDEETGVEIITKTGLLLLREQYEQETDIIEKETLRDKIEKNVDAVSKNLKAIEEHNKQLEQEKQQLKLALEAQVNLQKQNQHLQTLLQNSGTNTSLYKIDNIDCSSLKITISPTATEKETPKNESKPSPQGWGQTGKKFDDAKTEKIEKIGYLDKSEPLESHLTKKGYNTLKSNSPPPSWHVIDEQSKRYEIDNNSVTAVVDKNNKQNINNFVQIFEACEFNRFIAQGGDQNKFDEYKSKIIPRLTGADEETRKAVMDAFRERGLGTSLKQQQTPTTLPPKIRMENQDGEDKEKKDKGNKDKPKDDNGTPESPPSYKK